MIDGINAASAALNTFPNVDNSNNDGQKNQEEVSNLDTEETSSVSSTEKAEHSEESSNAQAKVTDHVESAQRDNEANAKSPGAQNEERGMILDILG